MGDSIFGLAGSTFGSAGADDAGGTGTATAPGGLTTAREAAVDRDKRRELVAVAREYLRHLPPSCPWRLEIVSVYYDQPTGQPQIELFRNIHLEA